jgi:hypothetical protein
MPGYHEQAMFDTNYHQISSLSSTATEYGNMKNHDHCEIYDVHLVFDLLKSCFRTVDIGYWAKVADDHKLDIDLTSVEAFRSSFIKHIYDGECMFRRGAGCASVVKMGRWAHLLGVSLIDVTLEWVDQGTLPLADFVRICRTLTMETNAKKKLGH